MAWNGRVVKTYGRQNRRMIKNEVWISPDIKPTATNVFSSPDTDLSVTSCNGSMDASFPKGKDHAVNARQTRQARKSSNLLDSPQGIMEESNKENVISLAPETPEEEQGSRRRGAIRNARVIKGRKPQQESTPKLFSSDSEDGLRKVVGRKALSKKTDMNVMEPVSRRGRQPSKEHQTSTQNIQKASRNATQSKRVKNIIENESYTIVRSPPPRLNRAAKRYKSSINRESRSSANTSLSPFALMESWIDTVAATSTPMVELVKLDFNDRTKGVLLEDSLNSLHNGVGKGCTKQKASGSCNCDQSHKTDDVAGKLFHLTLSDDEDEDNNGKNTKSQKGKYARTGQLRSQKNKTKNGMRQKKPSESEELEDVQQDVGKKRRVLRSKKNVNYKDDSDPEGETQTLGKTRPKQQQLPLRRTRLQAATSEEASQLADISSTSSLECSVVLSNLSCHDINTSLRSPSIVLNAMSANDVSPHLSNSAVVLSNLSCHKINTSLRSPSIVLKAMSAVDVSPHLTNSAVVLRGLSPKDLELLSSSESSGEGAKSRGSTGSMNCSVALHSISNKLQEMHLDSDLSEDSEDVGKSRRMRTRGHSKTEDSNEEDSKFTNMRRTRGQSKTEDSDVSEEAEKSRSIRTRGQSQEEKSIEENDSKFTNMRRTRGQSKTEDSDVSEETEEEAGKSKILRTRGQSQGEKSTEENDSQFTSLRRTRGLKSINTVESEDSDVSEETEEEAGKSRRLMTRGQSQGKDGHEEEESKLTNMRKTKSQTKESKCEEEEEDDEEELPFPVTPHKKHLSSFHTDSFKEVFTPKQHKDTGLIITGKEKVLQQCEQTELISFTDCITPAMMKKCTKIGEGVYGEVFRTTNSHREKVALKIIPIEGDFDVNEEPQKTFDEILPEIVISRELSYLSQGEANHSNNYIGVNRVSCCQGQYPKVLLTEWDKYDDRKGSENDRPDIFGDEQLYIVFEFADGGQDLESFEFNNLEQAVSIVQQIAGALAVAERELEFEHRDLHWGNVLIRATKEDQVAFRLGDVEYSVASHGLEVSIIDFTLSRLQKDDCTVFCDLSVDPTLFEGSGDYQFEIYRKMKKENDNNWEAFNPCTNVLWLHYIIDKLLNSKTYQQCSDSKAHRSAQAELRSFSRHLLSHESAEQLVLKSELFDL